MRFNWREKGSDGGSAWGEVRQDATCAKVARLIVGLAEVGDDDAREGGVDEGEGFAAWVGADIDADVPGCLRDAPPAEYDEVAPLQVFDSFLDGTSLMRLCIGGVAEVVAEAGIDVGGEARAVERRRALCCVAIGLA